MCGCCDCVLSVMRVVGGVFSLYGYYVCFLLSMLVCWCLLYTPLSILIAVLGAICSLLMFVSDGSGRHMVETYWSMGLVMAL